MLALIGEQQRVGVLEAWVVPVETRRRSRSRVSSPRRTVCLADIDGAESVRQNPDTVSLSQH